MRVVALFAVLLFLSAGRPPVVSLVELAAGRGLSPDHGQVERRVRVAHPAGWTGDKDPDRRRIRLFGPEGEGEMTIAVFLHPSELGSQLEELRRRHPGAAPSPPQAMELPGIDPLRGERATRFVITGREAGELVTIERAGIIVLFATVVSLDSWAAVSAQIARCYPTVEVIEVAAKKSER